MRRLFIGIAIVVVLIAVVLAVVVGNVDKYRPRVQAELQKKLGRPVTIGHLGLRLLPLSIRVDGLTIGEPPGFSSSQPFATAKDVYVSAGLVQLLRGNPQVKELRLDQPRIELIRNPAGVWNFSTLGDVNKSGGDASGQLTLDELKINDARADVTAQGVTGSARFSLDIHANGSSSQNGKLNYSGAADIPNATLSTGSLTQPLVIDAAKLNFSQDSGSLAANVLKAQGFVLTNVHANATFANDVLELSRVTAGLFGGQANGTLSIDTKASKPVCSANMSFSGVDTNALLSAVSSLKNTLYGSLAAQTNVSFAFESGADPARSLKGALNFNVTNGQLKNVNIVNELARVGKFLGTAPAQSASGTALRRFSGTLNIVNGVAATNNLIATLDAGSLSANGSLNLINQALDMHMTAVLTNSASQSAGGTHIGGFLTTALANNNGELVLPVLVTGTMAHPVFTPDVQALAKMRLGTLLPTSGDPSKLTSGVLNGILGQRSNPINSILNQFGKKKKP